MFASGFIRNMQVYLIATILILAEGAAGGDEMRDQIQERYRHEIDQLKSSVETLMLQLANLPISQFEKNNVKLDAQTKETNEKKKHCSTNEIDTKYQHHDEMITKISEVIAALKSSGEASRFRLESQVPASCVEALRNTRHKGIFTIKPNFFTPEPFQVYCDGQTHHGDWTVVLRRKDGSENFVRNWTEYQRGFGNLTGEFFIGLEKLHILTMQSRQELLVVLEDFQNQTAYAKYDDFLIAGESEQYALSILGDYSGSAGDSLIYHKSMKFSTFDKDNDWNKKNCAELYGAWWHRDCGYSFLNGLYFSNGGPIDNKGINWYHWNNWYSYKRAEMLIRPMRH